MKGKIVQVIGPVVDVEFEGELPAILTALETKAVDGHRVVLEVQSHVGGNRVRAVAMQSTDALRRGLEVENTGAPISVPVGKETLGRMFDVVGDVIDGGKPAQAK